MLILLILSIRLAAKAMKAIALILSLAPLAALAGGSNYGITPGARPNLAGKVTEWPVPTPRFARDPAAAPDGRI